MTLKMISTKQQIAILILTAFIGVYLCSSSLLHLNEVFQFTSSKHTQSKVNHPLISSHAKELNLTKYLLNQIKQYDRLVIVLIDALRADMVLGSEVMHEGDLSLVKNMKLRLPELNQYMPFTQNLVNSGQAIGYVGRASVPTVTMPRLKALLTGKAPDFIDILKNFNSVALENEENLMKSFYHANHRIVFYGDDTWLKLFPDVFSRSEGTSGFYTRDTVQVDVNVSRHLKEDLDPMRNHPKSKDWDVLILHYLGLDHVGHLRGPRSELMQSKLKEMDDTMELIIRNVQQQDMLRAKENNDALPTLVVICSDHGMSESGNHGGASIEETSALLLFVLPKQHNTDNEYVKAQNFKYRHCMQVDFVPTIAALFNLPIPWHSTGILLDAKTFILTKGQQVASLYKNYLQLYNLFQMKTPINQQQSEINENDLISAKVGAYFTSSTDYPESKTDDILQLLQLAISRLQNQLLTLHDGSKYNDTVFVLGLLFCISTTTSAFYLGFGMKSHPKLFDKSISVVLYSMGLQLLALFSSSGIENEHAVSCYSFTSVLLYHVVESIRSRRAIVHSAVPFSLIILSRTLRSRNQVINFARLNKMEVLSNVESVGMEYALDDSVSILSTAPLISFTVVPLIVSYVSIWLLVTWKLLSQNYVVRNSQTKNLVYGNSVLFTIGLAACYLSHYLDTNDSKTQAVLTNITAVLNTDTCAQLVYVISVCHTLIFLSQLSLWNLSGNVHSSDLFLTWECVLWLIVTLVVKEAQLPSLMLIAVELYMMKLFIEINLKGDFGVYTPLHYVGLIATQSLTAFFSLGNSHLVTTIDISGVYKGLSDYSQGLVGFLTFISIYAGPLLVLSNACSAICNAIVPTNHKDLKNAVNKIHHQLLFLLIGYESIRFGVVSFVVYLMRYHLFIWTVFAPKMLYEVAHTSFLFVFILITNLLS